MQIKNKLLLLLVMLTCGISAAWAQQHVTVDNTQNGTVSVDNASPAAGDVVTVTVTPDAGYQIAKSNIVVEATIDPGHAQVPGLKAEGPGVGFTIELQGDDPADLRDERTYTFTMPEAPYDVLITATFNGVTYFNVTVGNIENGSVEVDKTQAVENEIVNLTVTPDTGYELDDLYYMNGETRVDINGTSFVMPAANVTVYATFKLAPAMYLIGSFNEWDDDTKVPLTKNAEGKWVGTQAMDANAALKFKDENGTWIGAQSNGDCIVTYAFVKNGSTLSMTSPGENFKIPVAGTWTFTVDRDANPMTVVISGDWYFIIEVMTPTNGTLSADNTQALEGELVTLTVTPDTGYEVDEVYYMKGDQKVTIEGDTFNMPDGDVKVYATFKLTEYNITVNESENGSVEASQTKGKMGDVISLTVNPDEGYELETLTVMAGNEQVIVGNNQFTMPASDVTVTATFKKSTYTITVAETENGDVEASAETAQMGDVITLTITPDAGYELDAITVMAGETPVTVGNNQFTMPASNVTVTVTFKAIGYNITPEACENGSVTADKETATIGTTVTLTATPAEGYEVDKYYYKVGETQTVLEGNTFEMPASDVIVGATFKKSTYTITVAETENGDVEASAETAQMGDVITLTITPDAGYELDAITVMAGETPVTVENNQFTMPAGNVTVTVTFKAITYDVIIEESENGSVSTNKDKAAEGEEVTLTISADPEFELDVLKVDGEEVVVTGNTYTFEMPNHDVTVTATFKAVVHTFTVVGEPEELFGTEWDPDNEDNDMTLTDGIYIWTSEPTFLEGDVSFKVAKDHNWDVSYPSDNIVISGLKPGTYTLTVTYNPENNEVAYSIDGQADVYVFGEINGNDFDPSVGVKMSSEDGKIYTATVNVTDTENGYSFFAFTHKLGDWNTANYYRFLAQSDGNFLVKGATMNVELPMAYNGDNSMKIPAGDYTLTVDLENMELTITGGTQLGYILANGVEGVEYTIINDLAVVDRHMDSQQFFTSDGNENWITIKGGDFFADAILMESLKGGYVSGVFSDKNLNPYLTLTIAPIEGEDVDPVEPGVYSLANDFAPKVDEVIKVSKAYYNGSENTLRAYAPGGPQGQSLTVDISLFDYDFKDGYSYNVTGVINIKEPWTATSGKGLMDYVYPFQNYKILVLDADELAPPTAIDNIVAEQGVKSVRFYNAAGVESKVPFQGVNIVVKEMIDGSKVTTKAIIK